MLNSIDAIKVAAKNLPKKEQLELFEYVAKLLKGDEQEHLKFPPPKSISELGPPKVFRNLKDLKFDLWPEDERADDLIEFTYSERAKDRDR